MARGGTSAAVDPADCHAVADTARRSTGPSHGRRLRLRNGRDGVRRRAPALDGLRAIAVLAVLGYHLGIRQLPGGFLGVDVFFVLSGYVITDILIRARLGRGFVDLGRFWAHRARRLFPALAAMLIVVTAAATIFDRGQTGKLRADLLGALTYTSNWVQVAGHHSYFSRFQAPSLLQHLWSLGVEEQFYLLWPFVVALGLRFCSRQRFGLIALAGAIASATAMAVGFTAGGDPSRLYFGTDTHAVGLLLGAALAAWWPLGAVAVRLTAAGRRTLDALGVLGLAGVIAGCCLAGELAAATYRGGFAGVSAATVLVLLAVTYPGSRLGRLLGAAPLAWLGRRSYAVYLWHWPVIAMIRELAGTVAAARPLAMLGQAALAVGLAELSWRLVEQPFQAAGIWSALRTAGQHLRAALTYRRPTGIAAAAGLVGVAVLATTGLAFPPRADNPVEDQIRAGQAAIATHAPATPTRSAVPTRPIPIPIRPTARAAPIPTRPTAESGVANGSTAPTRTAPAGVSALPAAPHKPRPPAEPGSDVTMIGDSVTLASAAALRDRLPGISVDAEVGRQLGAAPATIAALRAAGELRRTVIVALGTNGTVTQPLLDQAYAAIGPGHRIVLLTVFAPRSWQDPDNRVILAQRGRVGVLVVDWHATIAGDESLLWSDDVHPKPAGARLYARTLAAALGE